MKLLFAVVLLIAVVFVVQPVWACAGPDCSPSQFEQFQEQKAIGIGGAGGLGGQGGTGGSVGDFSGAVGSVGDIVIGGTVIQVPREFPNLPPELQRQYSYAFGALVLKSHLQKEEKKLLNSLLGPIPSPGKGLNRKTIAKNAFPKSSFGIKRILNELPVFELLIKGDKGVSNYEARLQFNEDKPPAGPSESMQFVRKLEDGENMQILERSELESSGWEIGTESVIQGVPGVWLSGLRDGGYLLLMEETGYTYGAVIGVYRSNIQEASGKNAQIGGSGHWIPGNEAYNTLLNLGKGSGQTWENQKFDLVVAGLNRVKPDAALVIVPPPPPPPKKEEVDKTAPKEEPKKEEAASPAQPPQVIEKVVEKKVEVIVDPFADLPKFEPIRFELNDDEIKNFKVNGTEFKNLDALNETTVKIREKVKPLMEKYPDLKLYFVGYTSGEGPAGTFKSKTKKGKRFSNSEVYNRGGLGGLRANNVGSEIVLATGLDSNRCIIVSAGSNQNKKYDYGTKDRKLINTYQRAVHIVLGHDIATAKSLTK